MVSAGARGVDYAAERAPELARADDYIYAEPGGHSGHSAASLRLMRWGSRSTWHSQTTTTRQPMRRSARCTRASRRRFLANFSAQ